MLCITKLEPPETAPNRRIPDRILKATGTSAFGETTLEAFGTNEPGRFAEVLNFVHRHFCWVKRARGTTLHDRFYCAVRVRGTHNHIEWMIANAKKHPLFSKKPPEFVISDAPSPLPKTERFEIHVEAADDAQVAIVAAKAEKHRIDIAWMDISWVEAPLSGEIVAAQFHLKFDIAIEQANQFAHFLHELLELEADHQIINRWGPLRGDEPGDRPWWAAIGKDGAVKMTAC